MFIALIFHICRLADDFWQRGNGMHLRQGFRIDFDIHLSNSK